MQKSNTAGAFIAVRFCNVF